MGEGLIRSKYSLGFSSVPESTHGFGEAVSVMLAHASTVKGHLRCDCLCTQSRRIHIVTKHGTWRMAHAMPVHQRCIGLCL